MFDIEFGDEGEYRDQIVVGEPFAFADHVPEGVDYFHITGLVPGGPSVAEAPFAPIIGMRFTKEAPVKVGHGALVERTFSPPGYDLGQIGGVEFQFPAANPGGQVSVLRPGDEGFPSDGLLLAETELTLATLEGVPLYYELVGDDLGFAGGVEVTIHYDESAVAALGLAESALKMWHQHEGVLEDITVSLDTDANLITGYTPCLSGFTVGISRFTIPGDFNGDGIVDGDDIPIWQASFGQNAGGDADGDGDSDGSDFLIW